MSTTSQLGRGAAALAFAAACVSCQAPGSAFIGDCQSSDKTTKRGEMSRLRRVPHIAAERSGEKPLTAKRGKISRLRRAAHVVVHKNVERPRTVSLFLNAEPIRLGRSVHILYIDESIRAASLLNISVVFSSDSGDQERVKLRPVTMHTIWSAALLVESGTVAKGNGRLEAAPGDKVRVWWAPGTEEIECSVEE